MNETKEQAAERLLRELELRFEEEEMLRELQEEEDFDSRNGLDKECSIHPLVLAVVLTVLAAIFVSIVS